MVRLYDEVATAALRTEMCDSEKQFSLFAWKMFSFNLSFFKLTALLEVTGTNCSSTNSDMKLSVHIDGTFT